MSAWVLVVGGTGYFGRLLAEDLLRFSGCGVIVASRRREKAEALAAELAPSAPGRVRAAAADLDAPATLHAALEGAFAAVCAAGPFQSLPPSLLDACLERGVHYFDLADDRDFVLRAQERSRGAKNGIAICSGWSAAPALTAVLARIAAEGLDNGIEIDGQIAPGNRAPRRAGTVASLLHSGGRPFRLWRDGSWREVSGWSEPRVFPFPPPVGPRTGYLVDVPDCALFPALFSARSVSFRAGAELSVLNFGASLLAGVARAGLVADWSPAAGILRAAAAVTGSFGSDSGAVGVEVRGARAGRPILVRACVTAPQGGPGIAVLPASVTLAALASGRSFAEGPAPDKWIDRAGLETECVKRGWSLTVEEG